MADSILGGINQETTQLDIKQSLTLLKRLVALLKPLGIITGGGSNRLSVDVNSVTGAVSTVTTVTTVTTVGNVANQTAVGAVNAFEMVKAINRAGYNSGVRSKIV